MSETTPPANTPVSPTPESGVGSSAPVVSASSPPTASAPASAPAAVPKPAPEPAAEKSKPAKATAPTPTPAAPARKSGPGLWVGLLALIVAGVSIAMVALLWQKLGQTQQELARRGQDTSDQVVQARTLASQAEALTQELQARLTVAEVRLSEVSLQRSQLEELMLTLSRSRDDNLVQDLESALRLGYQQSQLTGSAQPLLSALQAADQRIARAAQPRLNPVQRAIARDIERIQGASLADIPSLVLRLDELTRQVDQWPVVNQMSRPQAVSKPAPQESKTAALAVNKGTSTTATVAPVTALPADTPSSDQSGTGTVAVAAPADGLSRGWARVSAWWQGVWSQAWADMTQSGRELVRVSRIDRPEAALLAPEQAFFLRENLKLQLLNARLGLLARQTASARSDLTSAESAVSRYFNPTSSQVLAAQAELRQLATDLVGNELPRPDETLAALTAAAGGR